MNTTTAQDSFFNPHFTQTLRQELSPQWAIAGIAVLLLTLITSSTLAKVRTMSPYPGFPVVALEDEGIPARESWLHRAQDVLVKGVKKVITGSGPRIILPSSFADEVGRIPEWSFVKFLGLDFYGKYPGFEPLNIKDDGHLAISTVRVKLTQSLSAITEDLSNEATFALDKDFGKSPEWKRSFLKRDLEDMVARLSSRVFLGKEVARNEDWIHITKNYAVQILNASIEMRKRNFLTLPLMHWFIPECRIARQTYKRAREIINGEVERRSLSYKKTIEAGEKPAKVVDAVSWAHEMAKDQPVDHTNFQITLSMVAIPTTSDLMSHAILHLCLYPEVVEPLREEVIRVIGKDGWQKTTLYKLRLMDSFVKEVQRMKPPQMALMRRLTGRKPVPLSNGLVIPPHAQVAVSTDRMMDPAVYPEPGKFDAYRFLRLREQPGNENGYQLATVSHDHMGFGYGEHACPGRFFAANEVKIALCHMILKYDWRFVDGDVANYKPEIRFESRFMVDPTLEIEYRRREEEIEL